MTRGRRRIDEPNAKAARAGSTSAASGPAASIGESRSDSGLRWSGIFGTPGCGSRSDPATFFGWRAHRAIPQRKGANRGNADGDEKETGPTKECAERLVADLYQRCIPHRQSVRCSQEFDTRVKRIRRGIGAETFPASGNALRQDPAPCERFTHGAGQDSNLQLPYGLRSGSRTCLPE